MIQVIVNNCWIQKHFKVFVKSIFFAESDIQRMISAGNCQFFMSSATRADRQFQVIKPVVQGDDPPLWSLPDSISKSE